MAKSPKASRPAPPDHNRPPTDEQIRASRMERLAALTAKHRAVDNKMAVKQPRWTRSGRSAA